MAPKKSPLALRIDPELLRRVDEARGDVSRTRFVERALEKALDGQPKGGKDTGPPVSPPASPRAPKKFSVAETWRR